MNPTVTFLCTKSEEQISLLAGFILLLSPLQLAVLLLRQAALLGPGQRRSPASGLPAHAGAFWDISGDRHAHRDFCPGNHHAGAPRQRSSHIHANLCYVSECLDSILTYWPFHNTTT